VSIPIYTPRRATLVVLLPVAAAYLIWQSVAPAASGRDWLDSTVGLVLGLYICSRPAANGIDLFFAERGTLRRIFTRSSGVEWMLLNAAVMIAGWFVILTAASRLPETGSSILSVR
jgi:hypothetical protein